MEESEELLAEVRALIAARSRDGIETLQGRVSSAAWADIVPRLSSGEIAVLLQWLPDDEIPLLLSEVEPAIAAGILRTLARNEAADVLEAMDPDDAIDVIAELPEAEAQQILVAMEPAE